MQRSRSAVAARTHAQKGQATLEFALISTTLLLFLIGTFDLGRAIYYYDILANMARDGARAASVLDSAAWSIAGNAPGVYPSAASYLGSETIVGATGAHSVGIDASALRVTITTPMGTARGFDLPVTVATQYAYQPMSGTLLGIGVITMTAQSTMFLR